MLSPLDIELDFDGVKLRDFDMFKTKYMTKTVTNERDAFSEKDFGEGLALAAWVRVQGTGTMLATIIEGTPLAIGGTLMIPLVVLSGVTVGAPLLLSKKKHRKEFKKMLGFFGGLAAFSTISVVTSPVRHVICPEKCYKQTITSGHPLYG